MSINVERGFNLRHATWRWRCPIDMELPKVNNHRTPRTVSMNFPFRHQTHMNEIAQCATNGLALSLGLEPDGHKKSWKKGVRKQIHACCMKKNYDSLTRLSQHQDKWQKCRKDVLRHSWRATGVGVKKLNLFPVSRVAFCSCLCSPATCSTRDSAPHMMHDDFTRGFHFCREQVRR